MKEFYDLERTLYKNSKKQFNYYRIYLNVGTLLHAIHSAVSHNFVGYVELLLKSGFDPNKKNKAGSFDEDGETPVSLIAQEKKNNKRRNLSTCHNEVNQYILSSMSLKGVQLWKTCFFQTIIEFSPCNLRSGTTQFVCSLIFATSSFTNNNLILSIKMIQKLQ